MKKLIFLLFSIFFVSMYSLGQVRDTLGVKIKKHKKIITVQETQTDTFVTPKKKTRKITVPIETVKKVKNKAKSPRKFRKPKLKGVKVGIKTRHKKERPHKIKTKCHAFKKNKYMIEADKKLQKKFKKRRR